MNWSTLLSAERLGNKICVVPNAEKKYPRSEFEKDYRRIVECASFRRLQDKTQVFPLDQSDFVRTRLTHSYEVSALAKTMGIMLNTIFNNPKFALGPADQAAIKDIPDILSCAGLLHDIGNPPFGHFGEEVIKKWFTIHLKNYTINDTPIPGTVGSLESVLLEEHKKDLTRFDGNAQALRVLSKLHVQEGDNGLNLTSAVLNTLVKYPSSSTEVREKGTPGYSLITKKMGYTEEDRAVYEEISGNTSAIKCRHPLAFILEAADDIAYKTADLEDAFKKGLFTLDELMGFVDEQIAAHNPKDKTLRFVKELFSELIDLRTKGSGLLSGSANNHPDLYAAQNWIPFAQEWLMYCAIYGFEKNYTAIMNGSYLHDLFYGTNHELSTSIIDGIMAKFIYPSRGIIKLELAADTILTNLLDKFTRAVLFHDGKYTSNDFVEVQAYQKLYSLISGNHRDAYTRSLKQFEDNNPGYSPVAHKEYDLYLRLLLVVDYISGMTDSYAKSLYQELNGIYGLSGIY